MNYQSIIIDTLGSDKGSEEVIFGASLLLNQYPNLHLILVGDENLIKKHISDLSRVSIIHTLEKVDNNDDVLKSIYDKPNASIYLACKELKENDSAVGLISSGNTGGMLMGVMKYLRKDPNLRPCLSALMPNIDGTNTLLVDVGATVDCSANQLHDFAILGRDFMSNIFDIKSPRIGLLSIGEESHKGNKVTKEAHQILKEDESINFVGNIEGNIALTGICDVLIGDGFTMNQLIKVTEGTAKRIIRDVSLLRKDDLELIKSLINKYDLPNLGGGIILGSTKLVMKCRGNSSREAILNVGKILLQYIEK